MSMIETPTGRDLDVLVAKKVVGCKVSKRIDCVGVKHLVCTKHKHSHYNYSIGAFMLPRYSTDIAAAWEVVEKLVAKGKYLEFNLYDHDGTVVICACRFSGGEWTKDVSVPLAICRAALKAIAK